MVWRAHTGNGDCGGFADDTEQPAGHGDDDWRPVPPDRGASQGAAGVRGPRPDLHGWAEIGDLADSYLQRSGEPVGPRLAEVLVAVRARTENRIAELGEVLRRIDDYRSRFADQLAGRADFRNLDPHFGATDP